MSARLWSVGRQLASVCAFVSLLVFLPIGSHGVGTERAAACDRGLSGLPPDAQMALLDLEPEELSQLSAVLVPVGIGSVNYTVMAFDHQTDPITCEETPVDNHLNIEIEDKKYRFSDLSGKIFVISTALRCNNNGELADEVTCSYKGNISDKLTIKLEAGDDSLRISHDGKARSEPFLDIFADEGNDDINVAFDNYDRGQAIDGGSGDDKIVAGIDDNPSCGAWIFRLCESNVDAGDGNDFVKIKSGWSEVDGDDGSDEIWGGPRADQIEGGNDIDEIHGRDGNDKIDGGSDNSTDWLYGGNGGDKLLGGSGNDVIEGGPGNDVMDGSWGGDRITDGQGIDTVHSGDGRDDVNVDDGQATLIGDAVDCGSDYDRVKRSPNDGKKDCEFIDTGPLVPVETTVETLPR